MWRFEEMPWLLRAPDDFRQRCNDAARPEDFAELAGHFLDISQLTRLARRSDVLEDGALAAFTLGLVSNSTVDLVVPGLIGSALRYGISLKVVATEFGRTIAEALDGESAINVARPDSVLIALDHRGLPMQPRSPDGADPAGESLQFVRSIGDGFARNCGASAIYQTVPAPPGSEYGSLDMAMPGAIRRSTAEFNLRLAETLESGSSYLLDVDKVAQTVGSAWHDPVQWNVARLAFSAQSLPLYCDHVARIIAAIRGKARKCLVLDLDNTLWGGVVGDDGLEGIMIAEGDPMGEAFRAVQSAALSLRERGVILAVCSKNEEGMARLPFRDHPDMMMTEGDIAVFVANWADKAINLQRIANALNIGLDALVLLDDNPAERAYVRSRLPDVAVIELPDDPAHYAGILLASGHFETVSVTEEDRKRAGQYRAEVERQSLSRETGDLEDFLRSLDMKAVVAPFDAAARKRITQLINKTNQFNLTTRRYTEAEVRVLEEDPDVFTLQVRLADRFGDNGIISVAICRPAGSAWEIDSWLMSCRVFDRRVEELVFGEIIKRAREKRVTKVVGRYRPTKRNGLVSGLFRTLKLSFVSEDPDGSVWEIDPAVAVLPDVPISVVTPSGSGPTDR